MRLNLYIVFFLIIPLQSFSKGKNEFNKDTALVLIQYLQDRDIEMITRFGEKAFRIQLLDQTGEKIELNVDETEHSLYKPFDIEKTTLQEFFNRTSLTQREINRIFDLLRKLKIYTVAEVNDNYYFRWYGMLDVENGFLYASTGTPPKIGSREYGSRLNKLKPDRKRENWYYYWTAN